MVKDIKAHIREIYERHKLEEDIEIEQIADRLEKTAPDEWLISECFYKGRMDAFYFWSGSKKIYF